MKLTAEKRKAAEAFLETQARPLEQALWSWHFAAAPAEPVIDALQTFQNPDGGFGNALEPDFRVAASSALCTGMALKALETVQTPDTHPLVAGAIAWLRYQYKARSHVWPIIPAHDNQAPHAPWWGYDEEIAARWTGFQANPRAEIVAHLWTYAGVSSRTLLDDATRGVAEFLRGQETVEKHDLLCCVHLAEATALPEDWRDALLHSLRPIVDRTVVRDASQWGSYLLTPLQVVASPASPFMEGLGPSVGENLDYVISSQGEDGAWAPAWSWFGAFAETWPVAEREWKGVLTLQNLLLLRAFDRLD